MNRLMAVIPIIVSFLSGGFAGAVFNWYMNRSVPTVITYAVTTTTTEAGTTAKSLIPNLKMQIGDKEISLFSIYVIEIQMEDGSQVDTADVAITFSLTSEIFGIAAEAPSPLHHIACSQIVEGVKCSMTPLTLGKSNERPDKYRISIATNQSGPVDVVTTANNVKLIKSMELDDFLRIQRSQEPSPYTTLLDKLLDILLFFCLYKLVSISERFFSEIEEIRRMRNEEAEQ